MADFTTLQTLLAAATQQQQQPTASTKFMLVSTHAQQTTGYSKVSYNIIKELVRHTNIEVFHFGFQRFFEIGSNYRPYPAGVDVYDPAKQEAADSLLPREQGFGFSQLPTYIRNTKPDVVMIYNDAAVICQFLEKLSVLTSAERASFKLVIYLDQVYRIQRPDMLARIDKEADAYFAFTEYWRQVLVAQGVKKPVHILRHGFDPHVWKPMDRGALRKKHGIPENLFVMLNLNRNTPRKRYDIVVTALAELVARFPTKPIALLCVCDTGETGGFPIHEIYARELIRRGVNVSEHLHKLMITKSSLTYTDEMVNELYALADIGVTAADGEGFGLCQFEAMGVGVPQVVPDIGGFKDFCRTDNAMLVKPTWTEYLPYAYSGVGGEVELVAASDLCLAIEEYLLDSDLRARHGAAARETVLKYSWAEEVEGLVQVLRRLVDQR
jgi:glycosyltransferase involved in cell wall biosynthesis